MNLEQLQEAFPHPVGPLRILVVDDQPVNIRALYEVFRGRFEVLMATSGEQAISLCREQRPDIILLDVVMPGLSGHEVCRRLKASPGTRDIPVIFVTSQNEEAEEALGFEIGAVDFITKPINPVIVLARVRTHLALKLQSDLLRSFAMIDGLTKVANRRKFDETLALSWRACQREGRPLSLVLLDLDYFKQYNDRYGHQKGDHCLMAVAGALGHGLRRPHDLLARYGGEEFVCILPGTDSQGAIQCAEVMREAVKALQIEHQDSAAGPFVSISLGIATQIPGADTSPEALLAQADRQLYQAKRKGRNRACFIDLAAGRDAGK
ncbi:diguanylate cyclase (GGDEF)-like protein [Oceanisphaera litoralis]|uniref:diguanylate cyclase domain-containing protein n=1 Tax=Oceanisphaera litoralis TaxID=225144 RepID=UPI0019563E62|nr:diguanylate cyclase [Oceanisphaera litoralis]MBM7455087.1 diguanylate cyclase (GGDEF)-like protein [Oceanisphaera litoralis]